MEQSKKKNSSDWFAEKYMYIKFADIKSLFQSSVFRLGNWKQYGGKNVKFVAVLRVIFNLLSPFSVQSKVSNQSLHIILFQMIL